jgi:hypothetical protein
LAPATTKIEVVTPPKRKYAGIQRLRARDQRPEIVQRKCFEKACGIKLECEEVMSERFFKGTRLRNET